MKNYSEDPNRQYHIQVAPGEIGRYVLIPGDPGRVEAIAAYLDNAREVAYNREYKTYTGYLDGEKVSVCSSGIGGASACIAMQELFHCGADTFIRVGTCGGMQLDVMSGDVVIGNAAIRAEGTSKEIAPIEFPAVADFDVTNALVAAANESGHRNHVGVVQCKEWFYGQHDPSGQAVSFELLNKWEAWKRMGCLASEMESAALFILAQQLRLRAGGCYSVVANQEREALGLENPVNHDTDAAIKIAIEAIRKLIASDRDDDLRDFVLDIDPECVIVDFDGTIAFTESVSRKAFEKHLDKLGIIGFDDWHWLQMTGHTDDEIWNMLRAWFADIVIKDSNDELIKTNREMFIELLASSDIRPNPWVMSIGDLLPDNTIVVSNNKQSVIEAALNTIPDALAYANFTNILSCADLDMKKLDVWDRARGDASLEKTIVIEDNPEYIKKALKIGYNVIAIRHDFNAYEMDRIANEYAKITESSDEPIAKLIVTK